MRNRKKNDSAKREPSEESNHSKRLSRWGWQGYGKLLLILTGVLIFGFIIAYFGSLFSSRRHNIKDEGASSELLPGETD